jgi:hypothetical protein
LVKFAQAGQTENIRKSALFWLANSRGKQGYEVVSKGRKRGSFGKGSRARHLRFDTKQAA